MTFNNVHSDTDCQCIDESCVEDSVSYFYRAIRSEQLSVESFNSHWEDGRKGGIDRTPLCQEVCERKSLSITKDIGQTQEEIKNSFQGLTKIKPKFKCTHYCRFRVASGAAKVKLTPSNYNENHYSLYKCDNFGLASVVDPTIQSLDK